MSDEGFRLPGASLDEVEKIVEAYSQKGGPASNDEIAQLVGSSSGTVSRCNGFLVAVNLVQGGQKKEATELRPCGPATGSGRKFSLSRRAGLFMRPATRPAVGLMSERSSKKMIGTSPLLHLS